MEGLSLPLDDGRQLTLVSQIGSGSFGVVYEAEWSETGGKVAVKVESLIAHTRVIGREVRVLREMKGVEGVVKMLGCGTSSKYTYFAMELLGKSLSHHFRNCDRHFSLATIFKLADEILPILAGVHSHSFVHRDIKPSNFLTSPTPPSIRLIDFGLSQAIRFSPNSHPSTRNHSELIGTLPFLSLNAHFGGDYYKKDDLESVLYMLVFLYKGMLPWQGKTLKPVEVRKLKSKIIGSELCEGMPAEFQQLFTYIRSLTFDSSPDYAWISLILREAGEKLEVDYSSGIDWNTQGDKVTAIGRDSGGAKWKSLRESEEKADARVRKLGGVKVEKFGGRRRDRENTIRSEFNPGWWKEKEVEIRESWKREMQPASLASPSSEGSSSVLKSCLVF